MGKYPGLVLIAAACVASWPAHASVTHSNTRGFLIFPQDPENQPKGLRWKGAEIPVKITRTPGPAAKDADYVDQVVAHLEGTYERKDWNLAIGDRPVPLDQGGKFTIEVPLEVRETDLMVTTVGPEGSVERKRLKILVPDWLELKLRVRRPSRHDFTAGANFTIVSYREDGWPSFVQTGLTVKGSYTFKLAPPTWDLGASFFVTGFPLTHPNEKGIRFLGLNLRAGYALPSLPEPWRLSLMAGFYYTTTFVAADGQGRRYGFSDMAGPQLFPVLSYALADGDAVSGYLKFSPVTGKFSLLSLENFEVALGGAYGFAVGGGHRIQATLDLAYIQLVLEGVRIGATSLSLGGAYAF